ncbi:AMP-dependent synthetase/ligase [Ferrimonas senticii]|uniref:AMP-dependent synthetase/ligase n=1 Tax=Ferrimonas senticii TaxID=394566 RepID=UPI00040B1B12|nr:long-chain fatty acid--CoA ligase [Ferrimonas senticii]
MSTDLNTYLVARQLAQVTAQRANQEAIRYQQNANWHSLTWQQLAQQSDAVAAALLALQVQSQDKVGIFAGNSLEWVLTDLACIKTRAVLVPIYATSTSEQAAYIVNDAGVNILFVGEQAQYQAALAMAEQCPSLTTLVLINPELQPQPSRLQIIPFAELLATDAAPFQAELSQRFNSVALTDLFTLIYTSGTTGEPKGVMLSHKNIAAVIQQHALAVPLAANTLSLSFLPLSHVYERGWSLYVLSQGGRVAYLSDPTTVQSALTEVKPEVMCAVPRLFEKIHGTISAKVSAAPLHKRILFTWCLRQGRRHYQAEIDGRKRSGIAVALHQLADKLVLKKLRDALGGNLQMMAAGGARLDDQVNRFFQYIGIPLLNGYGATETSATVTCNRIASRQTRGVGLPLPNLQVRIGADDEILVKGDTVMAGYYNRPAETNQAFEDGWYKTGDAGYIDNHGHLHITDRIKELMKTSNGKYVAPQLVEGQLALETFIEQAAIIADGRNYVSALIVPDMLQLQAWAQQQQIAFETPEQLLSNDRVQQEFQQRIQQNQAVLARHEQVKQFTLLPRPFSIDRGELTPTLKLRRKVITQVFASEIDAMYRRRH